MIGTMTPLWYNGNMKITCELRGGRKTFSISGKIVGTDIVELCKILDESKEEECDSIVVDLSNVGFIDSHGLGGLVYSHILLEKNAKRLIFTAPQGYTKSLFRDCGLEKVLSIVDLPPSRGTTAS